MLRSRLFQRCPVRVGPRERNAGHDGVRGAIESLAGFSCFVSKEGMSIDVLAVNMVIRVHELGITRTIRLRVVRLSTKPRVHLLQALSCKVVGAQMVPPPA